VTGRFKINNPSNNILLLLYGFLLKLPLFLNPRMPMLQSSDGPLYSSWIIWMQRIFFGFPVVFNLILFLLLYIQAISFNKAVNDQRMMQKPNYLTGMAYLLITSMYSEWFALSAAVICSTLLIWIWSKLCTLHNNHSAKTTIYNIGLVIGIASFLYYPAIIFVLLFMMGIAITRPFRLNEWLIGLLGIGTTFYFYAAWIFLSGQWNSFLFTPVSFSTPVFFETKWALAAILLVMLTLVLGFYFIQNNMRRQVVQTRKSWQLIYLYLLAAAFIPFINATNSFTSWILVAVPASLIAASAFFYPDKKWFPSVIHWGMVAICIAVSYFVK
jgi:hypothetical protein